MVIDRDEYFYVSFVTSSQLQIAKSTDDGANWSYTTINSDSPDKPHLWIDNKALKANNATNDDQGQMYAAYRKSSNNEIKATYFNGSSWSTATVISTGLTADWHQGVNIQTGPDPITLSQMNVYACWGLHDNGAGQEKDGFAIGFNKSTDGGATWGTAAKIADNISGLPAFHALGSTYKTMHVNGFPSMTVNPQNGYIFIVWTNYGDGTSCSFPTDCDIDPNIYMIKSEDGGSSWTTASSAIKVNTDDSGNDQWFPWIACDEASGALVCVYYDSRLDNDEVNTYVSISYDQGDTWTDTKISDESWTGVPPTNYGSYAGDYIGIDVHHNKAIPVWSDRRTTTPYSGTLLAFTNPFEVPCPGDMNLTYGDYNITDETSTFTYDAAYSVQEDLNVAGGSSTYNIYSGAKVHMRAGVSVTLDVGFKCEAGGLLTVTTADIGDPDPVCSDLSQRMNNESTEDDTKAYSPFTVSNSRFPVRTFPNPTTNRKINTYVPIITPDDTDVNNPTPVIITIFNSIGDVVYKERAKDWMNELDLSAQKPGLYLINVTKGNKVYNGKIILK